METAFPLWVIVVGAVIVLAALYVLAVLWLPTLTKRGGDSTDVEERQGPTAEEIHERLAKADAWAQQLAESPHKRRKLFRRERHLPPTELPALTPLDPEDLDASIEAAETQPEAPSQVEQLPAQPDADIAYTPGSTGTPGSNEDAERGVTVSPEAAVTYLEDDIEDEAVLAAAVLYTTPFAEAPQPQDNTDTIAELERERDRLTKIAHRLSHEAGEARSIQRQLRDEIAAIEENLADHRRKEEVLKRELGVLDAKLVAATKELLSVEDELVAARHAATITDEPEASEVTPVDDATQRDEGHTTAELDVWQHDITEDWDTDDASEPGDMLLPPPPAFPPLGWGAPSEADGSHDPELDDAHGDESVDTEFWDVQSDGGDTELVTTPQTNEIPPPPMFPPPGWNARTDETGSAEADVTHPSEALAELPPPAEEPATWDSAHIPPPPPGPPPGWGEPTQASDTTEAASLEDYPSGISELQPEAPSAHPVALTAELDVPEHQAVPAAGTNEGTDEVEPVLSKRDQKRLERARKREERAAAAAARKAERQARAAAKRPNKRRRGKVGEPVGDDSVDAAATLMGEPEGDDTTDAPEVFELTDDMLAPYDTDLEPAPDGPSATPDFESDGTGNFAPPAEPEWEPETDSDTGDEAFAEGPPIVKLPDSTGAITEDLWEPTPDAHGDPNAQGAENDTTGAQAPTGQVSDESAAPPAPNFDDDGGDTVVLPGGFEVNGVPQLSKAERSRVRRKLKGFGRGRNKPAATEDVLIFADDAFPAATPTPDDDSSLGGFEDLYGVTGDGEAPKVEGATLPDNVAYLDGDYEFETPELVLPTQRSAPAALPAILELDDTDVIGAEPLAEVESADSGGGSSKKLSRRDDRERRALARRAKSLGLSDSGSSDNAPEEFEEITPGDMVDHTQFDLPEPLPDRPRTPKPKS